jgi:phage terminase large subunit-like protein
MLQFGLRQGTHPQACITSTPRGLKFLRDLDADPSTVTTIGSTYENKSNLAPSFLAAIKKKYEGTRLGRQEIDAEILDDNPGALWKRAWIESTRLDKMPQLSKIVIAWDPATTAQATSDEHGILAVGAGMCSCLGKPELHGFVLEDVSSILSPKESCDRVVSVYVRRMANAVIGETNQGGDFLEALLRANPNSRGMKYVGVHAKDGKRLRAEPVLSLYEQKRVHHIGCFPKLEDEMCMWDPLNQVESPNRVDALVHGLTAIMVVPAPQTVRRGSREDPGRYGV